MGVYLSAPITEKISSDKACKNFTYGASSMQGWRMSQEDAHNCIPDFDEETDTALFAVYDGHGGAEVAQYCALHLPDCIRDLENYKSGKLNQCLEDAFLKFDEILTQEEVIKQLKVMAGVDSDGEEEEESGPVGHKEADMLRAEADMPLEDLLAKYEGLVGLPAEKVKQLRKQENVLSPVIRPKVKPFSDTDREVEIKKDSADTSEEDNKNNSASAVSSVTSSGITRLDNKLANGHADNENNLNTEKEIQEESKRRLSERLDNDIGDMEVSSSTSVVNKNSDLGEKLVQDGENCIKQKVCPMEDDPEQSGSDSLPSSSTGSTEKIVSAGSSSDSVQSGPSSSCTVSDEPGPSGNCEDDQPGSSGTFTPKMKSWTEVTDDSSESEEDEDDEYEEESDEEEEEEEEEEDDGIIGRANEGEETHSDEPGSDSGCTAVVALLRNKELVVANAGDSRCVLCRAGKAVDLSFDHKPEDDPERKRIEAAGGKVTPDGRVNGGLNLSRALGDHFYKRNTEVSNKEQMITALPDLQTISLQEDDEFVVFACDGIWNYMTSQEVVDFIKERLQDPSKKQKMSKICEEIFDHCLAPNTMGDGTGCDNMTAIIVTFDQMFNNNQNKRTASQMDTGTDGEDQPEKKTKIEEEQTKE